MSFPQPPQMAHLKYLCPAAQPFIEYIPLEVLTEIFKFVVDDEHPSDRNPNILLLTSVCHKWRSLAICTAALWTALCGDEPLPVLNTYLKRSMQAPLTLVPDHDHERPTSIEGAAKILGHMSHLKVLDLVLAEEDWTVLSPLMSQPTETVEELSLSFHFAMGMLSETDDVPVVPIDSFGGGQKSTLARIFLSGCRINWSSPLLINLTELSLDNQDRPTYEILLAVLNNLPNLELLNLEDCLPESSPDATVDAAYLPCLRDLCIVDDHDKCIRFLEYVLCAPTHITVDCEVEGASSGSDIINACTHRLNENLPIFPLTEVQLATHALPWGHSIQMTGFHSILKHGSRKWSTETLVVTLNYADNVTNMESIVIDMLTSTPLAEVISLECCFFESFSPIFWLSTLPTLIPGLRKLWLFPPSLRNFIQVYYVALLGGSAHTQPFAALETLHGDWSDYRLERHQVSALIRAREEQGLPFNRIQWQGWASDESSPA